MKTTNEYITHMRCYMDRNSKRLGIKSMGIFGSVARGEQNDDSDLDVFVDLETPSYHTLCRIKEELEELCRCDVDIVRLRPSLRPLLQKRIQEDGITI